MAAQAIMGRCPEGYPWRAKAAMLLQLIQGDDEGNREYAKDQILALCEFHDEHIDGAIKRKCEPEVDPKAQQLEKLVAQNDDIIKTKLKAIEAFKEASQIYWDSDYETRKDLEINWDCIQELVEDEDNNHLQWPEVACNSDTLEGEPMKTAYEEHPSYVPTRLEEEVK